MKFKHVFTTLCLAAFLGLGAGIGLKHSEVKETKAAVTDGSFIAIEAKTNWTNLNGNYQLRFADADASHTALITPTETINGGFFIYKFNSSDFDFTPTKVQAYKNSGNNYSDYFNLSSMSDTIWVPDTPGTTGGGTYAKGYTNFTVSVSFSSPTDEGQQIYIGSDLNGWGFIDLEANASRTVYSKDLVYAGSIASFKYKLLTSASGESKTWNNVIIADGDNNATATITAGVAILDTDNNYFDKAEVSCTLKVIFTSAVPSRVNIHIRGTLNDWSDSVSISKLTRVSDTVFTYAVTNLLEGTYQYKLVGAYSDATIVDWSYEIDTGSNKTFTLSASDNGEEVSLGSRTYDFDTNMPETYVAADAVVSLTFGESYDVPSTINIYFVGSLTNWGTTGESLAAARMTRVSSKVYTWSIPSDTHTGPHQYKIVAMSAYSGETTASYEYLVYGVTSSNETLNIDTSTTNYALNALTTNLSPLGAKSFAQGFNSAMATPCADEDANNKTAVSAIWGTWKSTFEGLPSGSKTQFGSSSDTDVVQARSLYLHCVTRYSLAAWTDAPTSVNANISIINPTNTTDVTIVIIVVSFVSLIALGGFFFIRKKKRKLI